MLDDAQINAAYLAMLGRLPDQQELRNAKRADMTASLTEQLLDTGEYRNRFRNASDTDENARLAGALWPIRDYDLQIVVVSGDGWTKCRETIHSILARLSPRVLLTVMCGERDEVEWVHYPGVELHVFHGASVFDLRARIPSLLKECGWVALVEDHATPHRDWLPEALRAVGEMPEHILSFSGTVTNDVTRSGWGWANFLFNFAYHLHPAAAKQLNATVTTLFFRRDLVGIRPLANHEFERRILGRRGPVLNAIRVDHAQRTNWWEATTHVFDNGLVAGSSIRRLAPSPRTELLNLVKGNMRERLRDISEVLHAHPESRNFPRTISAQLWWISLCHSSGALLGAVFGSGRAHKRLE